MDSSGQAAAGGHVILHHLSFRLLLLLAVQLA
jgi:hypothetical protein